MNRVLLREIVLGLWKIHILHHACTEGVVGHHMIQELREHGYEVSPGTLYPLLHRMERNGWLTSGPDDVAVHGARTYRITPLGAEVLTHASAYVRELHREIAESGCRATAAPESEQTSSHENRGKRRNE